MALRSARRRFGPWSTLLSLALGAAASCRGYEPCDDSPGGSCAPKSEASGASGREQGDGGSSGTLGANGGAGDANGGAGDANGGGGAAGADSGEAGSGGTGESGHGGAGGRHQASNGGAGESGHGGASSEGGGGEAGAATLVCSENTLDCDASTLNGCETNVLESLQHCGGCVQRCAGLCMLGRCREFERMIPNQFAPDAIALAPDFAFLAAHDSMNVLSLLRVSRWTGEIATVASSIPWAGIRALVASSTRLYVADAFGLFSLALDGTDPKSETLEVESVAAKGRILYYSLLGGVYRWSEETGATELVRDFPGASIQLVSTEYGVFIAANYPTGDEPAHYEIYFLVAPAPPALFDAGSGEARDLVASYTDAYFMRWSGFAAELRHVAGPGQGVALEPDARGIAELAAVAGGVFATFWAELGPTLRHYSFHNPPVRSEWETPGYLLGPTSTAEGELWFIDNSQAALVRVTPFERTP